MENQEELFIIDKAKRIRVFGISATKLNSEYIISSYTGLIGGKYVTKETRISKGYQGRSIDEQAELMVKSMINDKKNEGYKSQKDLYKKAIDIGLTVKEDELIGFLFKYLPNASQTNGNWTYLPMLAHPYSKVKDKLTLPCIGQPKLNGVRGIVQNIDDNIVIGSRGGEYYYIPHLKNQLAILFNNMKSIFNHNNFILDGEIYKHGVALQEISGAARLEVKDNELFPKNSWLEYHIYDIINLNDVKENNLTRLQSLYALGKVIYLNQNELQSIKIVESTNIQEEKQIIEKHNLYVENGYEGLILRQQLNSPYEFNDRSYNLIKFKLFTDEEFEIIDVIADEGAIDLAETVRFRLKNNNGTGTSFLAVPTGTMEAKVSYYNKKSSFIGKQATVRFFERSNDGIPTHANLRSELTKCLQIEHIRPYGE
jgi:hypothetical protein